MQALRGRRFSLHAPIAKAVRRDCATLTSQPRSVQASRRDINLIFISLEARAGVHTNEGVQRQSSSEEVGLYDL